MSSTKSVTRCHHVTTAGVQCDSPAVKTQRYCYYHMQGRSTAVHYYSESPACAFEGDLPLFEDAHSIQIAIRQVASLLIQKKIEHKAASLLLYSMQLALMNLKYLQAEKPQPARLVVELDKFEETMPEPVAEPEPAPQAAVPAASESAKPRAATKAEKNQAHEDEVEKQLEYLIFLGRHLDDPGGTVPDEAEYHRLKDAIRRIGGEDPSELVFNELRNRFPPSSEPDLPPGSIQASIAEPRRLRRNRFEESCPRKVV